MPVMEPLDKQIIDALRPLRTDPETFAAGVRERIEAGEREIEESGPQESDLLRAAASFLPLPLIMGGKAAVAGLKSAPTTLGSKVVGYAALPAISVFLMLGAFLFTTLRIRSAAVPQGGDVEVVKAALQAWWRRHCWIVGPFYVAMAFSPFFTTPELLFVLLVVSMVALAFLLGRLARAGMASRPVIAHTCLTGLLFLVMAAGGARDTAALHLMDPRLVRLVLYAGILILAYLGLRSRLRGALFGVGVFGLVLFGALVAWSASSLWDEPNEEDMAAFVSNFDHAEFHSATWRKWAQVARSARQEGLEVDWSKPRALLDTEIKGEQNPYILDAATQAGLFSGRDTERLDAVLEKERPRVLGDRNRVYSGRYWIVYALLRDGRLSRGERERLVAALHQQLADLDAKTHNALVDVLAISNLLDALKHPLKDEAHLARVHEVLRDCHSSRAGGFKLAGGFQPYVRDAWGSYVGTWTAVQLMRRHGVPKGLDLNWVRSFLRPGTIRVGADRHLAAITRTQLEQLPAIQPVTWRDILRHERTLIAAILLVLLCLYATLRAPSEQRQRRDPQ